MPTDNGGSDELPGLDDFEDTAPGNDQPVDTSSDGVDQWTREELDEWYEKTPGADDTGFVSEELADDLGRAYKAMDLSAGGFFTSREWRRLTVTTKAEYRRQFEAQHSKEANKKRLTNFVVVAGGALIVLIFLSWFFTNGPGSETPTATDDTAQSADGEEAVTATPDETEAASPADSSPEPTTREQPTTTPPGSGGNTVSGMTVKTVTVEHVNPYIVTVEVEGDGRALAEDSNTKWYNPRVNVTTTDGGFIVDGKWSGSPEFRGSVFEEGDFFVEIPEATLTGEWVADGTFVYVADNVGLTGEPVSAIVEMTVRVTDESGADVDYDQNVTWQP